jgi:predicted MFS family arabinose efflux permease
MTVATLATATSAENRKAVIAGTIGNVLEWYDFGVYGYLATTMSQLFFPGDDKTVSLLKAFAVFGVGFVMRPVGSVLFGIYGDRFGRRLALSAVVFLMAFSTVAIGLLPTYAQAGVLAPILLVVFRRRSSRCVDRVVSRIADCCFPQNPLSFPKIRSGRIRGVRQNQRIIRCDVCDHRVYPDEAHRRA